MPKIWRSCTEIHVVLACGHAVTVDRRSMRRLRRAQIGNLWICWTCTDAATEKESE